MSPRAMVVMPEDAADRQQVVTVVEELGFDVEVHGGASRALGAIQKKPPALVVHSCDLSDMGGATFHNAIGLYAGGAEVPRLAILPATLSREDRFAAATAISAGIQRPIESEGLERQLRDLLDRNGSGVAEGEATVEESRRESFEAERVAAGLLPVRTIGLGRWGVRVAETLASRGVPARALDDPDGLEETRLAAKHPVHIPWSGSPRHLAASERLLEDDPVLGNALAESASDASLMALAVDLSAVAGTLLPAMLRRLEDVAPGVGRLVVARLPSARSGTDERQRALDTTNAILDAPESGVLLVRSPWETGTEDEERVVVGRLAAVLELASGSAGEVLHQVGMDGVASRLGTPGFHGIRLTRLSHWDVSGEEEWESRLAMAAVDWQPEGFDWGGAQSLTVVVSAPGAWLDQSGVNGFERIVEAAYEEAAPCALARGLYVGEEPAVAIMLSAGMPLPAGVLDLRDTLTADRARLAEKRRAALRPMRPLLPPTERPSRSERRLPPRLLMPPSADVELFDEGQPEAGSDTSPTATAEAVGPDETEAGAEGRSSTAAPTTADIPRAPDLPADDHGSAATGSARTADDEPVGPPSRGGTNGDRTAADSPVRDAPPVYLEALELARQILHGRVAIGDIDLDEIRYAVYDLLEVLREEPERLLAEVLRPDDEDWFARHHVNVTVLALLTGSRLEKSFVELIEIGIAAFLHDLGMVPTREVWDRESRLEATAFGSVVRPHPEVGYRRLQEIPGMTRAIARVALHEHERLDGTGYPEGLGEDAIEPGARLLAVCDTFEAMTHPRPHRAGLAKEPIDELGRESLDPTIVEALINALADLRIRREVPFEGVAPEHA